MICLLLHYSTNGFGPTVMYIYGNEFWGKSTFSKICMDEITQKSYKKWSYAIFVSRELKSIKSCFRTYIGRYHTLFSHPYQLFFQLFRENRRPGHRKKSQKSWKMKFEIWVFCVFVIANVVYKVVINMFLAFFYDVSSEKFSTNLKKSICENYLDFTFISGTCTH